LLLLPSTLLVSFHCLLPAPQPTPSLFPFIFLYITTAYEFLLALRLVAALKHLDYRKTVNNLERSASRTVR
jgi:hypothetical protein